MLCHGVYCQGPLQPLPEMTSPRSIRGARMNLTTVENLDFALPSQPGWGGHVFNEAFDPSGQPRPHWAQLIAEVARLSANELANRSSHAQDMLHENGITFNVFSGTEDQRPWTLDVLPLLLDRHEWNWLSQAISQRARLLQSLVRDIYGSQELLRSGLLPPEVIFPQPRYQRAFSNLHQSTETPLLLYATELARGTSGQWVVMADRTDAPVGPGFALENRIITSRLMPQIVHRLGIERLAPFFIRVKNALARLSGRENPRIVLLSGGPKSRFYFEDVYLARYLGFTLVEGSDLAVRSDRVYLKTLSGLQPVDAIYSRSMESWLDPLEQGDMANAGVPGLLQAVREGHVHLVNAPGCGLLELPVFMAFLPQLCQHILGESLMLPSIATWWYGDAESRKIIGSRFGDMVIKPAFQSSGQDEFIVSQMTSADVEVLRTKMERYPSRYIAQERIERSAAPCWRNQQLQPGHVALRTYAVANDVQGYDLMPGGLVRIAETSQPMELSVLAGVSSKDLWIQAEEEVTPITLLEPANAPVRLKRSEPLFPSRVADNLFWFGQSLERADFLARLLRCTIERLASESNEDLPELPGLLRVLVDQGQIEPGFLVREFTSQLPQLEQFLVKVLFDPTEPMGLANAIAELRRLNSSVRDWISPDLWKMTQMAAESYFDSAPVTDDFAELLSLIDQLLFHLSAISGQIQDGMIRGPAWRFLDIGRRIDRAKNIATLVQSTIDAELIADRAMLKVLLEILDCRMTYRTRYLDNLQQNGVLDLAVTDETNPHSVAFQGVLLVEHLASLPQEQNLLRSAEQRSLMKLVHATRMITGDFLEESPPANLRLVLHSIVQYLKELSDELTRKYLVHAVQPRRMGD